MESRERRAREWIVWLALVATAVGCSASASSDGGAPGSGGVGSIDAGADNSPPLDAAPEARPVGIENVDGTPCPAGVSCASGLCGAGGRCLPKYLWSRPLAQGGCVNAMVASPDGNFVVLGSHPTTNPLTGTGAFIEKVDPDLNIVWRHTFGGFSGGGVTRPAVLADGTVVFAVGGATVSFDSGMTISHTTADIQTALVAISSAGSYLWFKSYPTPPNADGSDQIGIGAVAANPQGGMTLGGSLRGQVTFDFDGVVPPLGARGDGTISVFVAEYDTTGKLAWVNAYRSSKWASIGSGSGTTGFMGVAPDGGIYIAGGFVGDGAFGTSPDSEKQYVAHLDAVGSITAPGSWVVNPPGLWPSFALARDGSFFQTSSTRTESGPELRRIAPTTGQAVWSFPTPTWSASHLAASNDLIVAGIFEMPTDFDPGPGQALVPPPNVPRNTPYATGFLAAYTTDGQLLWVRGPNVWTDKGVTIGPDGSLYYLNVLTTELTDFDPGSTVDAIKVTNFDCVITKYKP